LDSARTMFLLLSVLLFTPISMLLGYVTSPVYTVFADYTSRVPKTIKICPTMEVYEDTKVAVGEWNKAIMYFAFRFAWFTLLGLRLEVAESDCDAYIVLGKPYEVPLAGDMLFLDERFLGMTHQVFESGRITHKVIISDLLPPERRVNVIMHELTHVLGLSDSYILNVQSIQPLPMSHISTLGKITSYDVYALYAKYVKGAEGVLVGVPPYIPYMTADMPLPDIASGVISALVAFVIKQNFLRKRRT
jgi:hypothetical protein